MVKSYPKNPEGESAIRQILTDLMVILKFDQQF